MAKVELNISGKDKGKGWTPVLASDNNEYWYKFTGGNKFNNGDQVFAIGAQQTFTVSLKPKAKAKYNLCGFVALNDPDHQLSGSVASDAKSGTVTDACSRPCSDMIYGFRAHPLSAPGSMFFCHPRIHNQLNLE